MSKIIPLSDKDLGIIYIEVVEYPEMAPEKSIGGTTKLGSKTVEKVVSSLDDALNSIGILAGKITNAITNNPMYPDEIECKVGIKLTADTKIVIANAGAEGSLEFTFKWNSKQMADRDKNL
jgi:hypothetical protein